MIAIFGQHRVLGQNKFHLWCCFNELLNTLHSSTAVLHSTQNDRCTFIYINPGTNGIAVYFLLHGTAFSFKMYSLTMQPKYCSFYCRYVFTVSNGTCQVSEYRQCRAFCLPPLTKNHQYHICSVSVLSLLK